MDQTSNAAPAFDAPTSDEERPEPITFTLVVVSPSVGVTGPLTFPHLPATTTVKELKAKIRDALTARPADESQRLIHRGRMLARELETMMDIFGRETLANPESQTLHLVLRPSSTDPPSTHPSTPLVGPQRVTTPLVNPLLARPRSTPINQYPPPPTMAELPPELRLPGFQHVAQHQMLHQTDNLQNMMAQRLQHLQQETVRLQQDMLNIEQRSRALAAANPTWPPQTTGGQLPGAQMYHSTPQAGFRTPQLMTPSVQQLINQQQRERAANGQQGVQDSGSAPSGTRTPRSGRASPSLYRPDHSTTHTREGVGPNGERWQITVNETTTTFPIAQHTHHAHHHHHPAQSGSNPVVDNFQAILRNADRVLANHQQSQAHSAGTSNPLPMTANSESVTQSQQSAEPSVGVVTPASTNGSPATTVTLNPPSGLPISFFSGGVQPSFSSHPTSNSDPVVYLLSSPQGPRALLLHNSDTFFTPRQPSRRRRHDSPVPNIDARGRYQGLPEFRNRLNNNVANNERIPRARPERIGQIQGNGAQPAGAHANPGAGALAAQIGPMLWLIIRLAGFVWFFTAGNRSWTRFLMVTALAIAVFIINTGIFNGLAEQLWGPIRRHIEALIPLAGPEAALIPAANAAIPNQVQPPDAPANRGNEQGPRRRRGELDPAEVAARLIEQHRQANGGWLLAQIRRAEHAALLFLASLVPGVGERHIAAREAEASAAEAERQRVEAEAAAQVEAEAEAAAAENATSAASPDTSAAEPVTEGSAHQDNQQAPAQEVDGDVPAVLVQPLINV